MPRGMTSQPWSGLTRILPFLEQSNLYNMVNWSSQFEFTSSPTLAMTRVAAFLCPSEINDIVRIGPTMSYYPNNYCFNQGTWFIYDPVSGQAGDGPFEPNQAYTPASMTDGLSNTLGMSEAKAYQPNYWDTQNPSTLGVVPPLTPTALAPYIGGTFDGNGHTEWVEGDVHEVGFTTTFPPNTKVMAVVNGIQTDIDLTSMRDGESITLPTYAAVTARSYHPGVVSSLLLDGSVRAIKNSINVVVWRGLGTRANGETLSADAY